MSADSTASEPPSVNSTCCTLAGVMLASFARSVADLDEFVRHAARESGHGPGKVSVIAQSVGAVTATRWLQTIKPRVCCVVLAAPAF